MSCSGPRPLPSARAPLLRLPERQLLAFLTICSGPRPSASAPRQASPSYSRFLILIATNCGGCFGVGRGSGGRFRDVNFDSSLLSIGEVCKAIICQEIAASNELGSLPFIPSEVRLRSSLMTWGVDQNQSPGLFGGASENEAWTLQKQFQRQLQHMLNLEPAMTSLSPRHTIIVHEDTRLFQT